MGWLRSRWTVVALVPAFFLAGFGIVTALAGGSDEPAAEAAQSSSGDEAGGPAIVTVIEGADSTETSAGPGAATSTGDGGGAGGSGTPTGDDGDGNAPPAPPPGVINVDYRNWDGVFELASPEIVPDFAAASVIGELSYLGGVDCAVGLVRVRAWFYSEGGTMIGGTVWESVQSTGDGGEVTGREPVPFEAYGQVSEAPASAALRFTAVECL
jgi:hypothetical protein